MGFLDAFDRWFAKTTDAPMVFGRAAALACLSSVALGRRYLMGTDPLHPNIFLMLVGPSTKYRKSTAVRRAEKLIRDVHPNVVGPNDITSEGLIARMDSLDKVTGQQRSTMSIFIEEFGGTLAATQTYAKTLKPDLCKMYDCAHIEKVRARSTTIIKEPRVSMFVAAADEMLQQYINVNDWLSGFMMRWIYIQPEPDRVEFDRTPPAAPNEYELAKTELLKIRGALERFDYAFDLTPGAEAILSLAGRNIRNQQKNFTESVYAGRFTTIVQKLAILYQIDINPNEPISEQAALSASFFASKICWKGFQMTHQLTAMTGYQAIYAAVLSLMQEHDGELPNEVILTKFHGNKDLSGVLEAIKRMRVAQLDPDDIWRYRPPQEFRRLDREQDDAFQREEARLQGNDGGEPVDPEWEKERLDMEHEAEVDRERQAFIDEHGEEAYLRNDALLLKKAAENLPH